MDKRITSSCCKVNSESSSWRDGSPELAGIPAKARCSCIRWIRSQLWLPEREIVYGGAFWRCCSGHRRSQACIATDPLLRTRCQASLRDSCCAQRSEPPEKLIGLQLADRAFHHSVILIVGAGTRSGFSGGRRTCMKVIPSRPTLLQLHLCRHLRLRACISHEA